MHTNDLNEGLDNLGNFDTNKDQTLGRVIAEVAALIAQGAHLVGREESVPIKTIDRPECHSWS